MNDFDFVKENIDNKIIEQKNFKNNNFRKIEKNLIYDIAKARIRGNSGNDVIKKYQRIKF